MCRPNSITKYPKKDKKNGGLPTMWTMTPMQRFWYLKRQAALRPQQLEFIKKLTAEINKRMAKQTKSFTDGELQETKLMIAGRDQ